MHLSIVHKENVEVKKERVLEGSKATFMVAIDAFLSHHANFNCRNLNTKTYKTSCTCLSKLLDERNGELVTKQVCDSVWEYFSRTKDCQVLVMKDWLRMVYDVRKEKQLGRRPVKNFIVPGAYADAPRNTVPLKICVNALSVVFNHGYNKLLALKKDLSNSGRKAHGLKNKPSNRTKNYQDRYQEIDQNLNKFFEGKNEKQPKSTANYKKSMWHKKKER